MNKETLDHLELCIFAEQTHDVNFQNIAKELFREVYFQKNEVVRLNNIINELEKDINNQLMMTRVLDEYNEGYIDATLHYYNKLKELKEEK